MPGGDSDGSAHLDAHAYTNPTREPADLLVGEGDASLRPIERFVNSGVPRAEAVNPEISTERRVLRRRFVGAERSHDSLVVLGVDTSAFECTPCMLRARKVDPEEQTKARAWMDSIDPKVSEGCGSIPTRPRLGWPTSPEGDVVEPSHEPTTTQHGQRMALGVDQDPRLRSRTPSVRPARKRRGPEHEQQQRHARCKKSTWSQWPYRIVNHPHPYSKPIRWDDVKVVARRRATLFIHRSRPANECELRRVVSALGQCPCAVTNHLAPAAGGIAGAPKIEPVDGESVRRRSAEDASNPDAAARVFVPDVLRL